MSVVVSDADELSIVPSTAIIRRHMITTGCDPSRRRRCRTRSRITNGHTIRGVTTRITTSGTDDPDPDFVDSVAEGIEVTVTGDDEFTASGVVVVVVGVSLLVVVGVGVVGVGVESSCCGATPV